MWLKLKEARVINTCKGVVSKLTTDRIVADF